MVKGALYFKNFTCNQSLKCNPVVKYLNEKFAVHKCHLQSNLVIMIKISSSSTTDFFTITEIHIPFLTSFL